MAWKPRLLRRVSITQCLPPAGRANGQPVICPLHGLPMGFIGWTAAPYPGIECEVWVCWKAHPGERFDGADMTILWPRGFTPEKGAIDTAALWAEVKGLRPHFTARTNPVEDMKAGSEDG